MLLFNKTTFGSFLIFLCIFFIYPARSFPQSTDSNKYGGQIVLGTTSDPKSFNPIIAKETSTTAVTGRIFEGLTQLNVYTLKVEPWLAKDWQVSEDGLVWTFNLRDDVKWSDGEAFSADDVVFTFNDLIYNEDIPSSARDIFTIEGKVFSVKKIDDYTVEFTLPVKFAPFLRGMSQSILPKHKLEQVVKDGRFNFTWGIDTDPKEIVGTGAYMLSEYSPGERLVFERNPYYWRTSKEGDRLPYIDKQINLIVQNADVVLLKFLEGTLDSYGLRGMDYPLLKPLEQKNNFTIFDLGPGTSSNFITFNQNTGVNPQTGKPFVDPVKLSWFTNNDFRRAIAHAIDKEKIIEIVQNGLGYPQDSAMSPAAGFFHNPDVDTYDYDLKRAAKILKKGGFIDRDGDGYLEDKKGNVVKFNLYTNAGGTERIDMAAIIRQDLEKLGMKVNFQALEFNTLVSRLTSTFDWDAILIGLTGGIEPHFGKNVWHSSGQLHMWYPKQEEPQTSWEARINELFSLGVQELDEDKRKVYYDEFQSIVAKKLPVVYTVLDSTIVAVRNKFENLDPTNYGGALHNIEELWIKEENR